MQVVPYGYRLVESGEISKKGRILHKFEIDEEKAEIVKTIYDYAYFQMLGPYQIARLLNADTQLKILLLKNAKFLQLYFLIH